MLGKLLMAIAASYSFMAPLPQKQYQINPDTEVRITFADPLIVHLFCGGKLGDQFVVMACTEIGGPHMLMPNPCAHTDESYARLLCHEMGHINGWPANHPNPLVEQSVEQTHP